MATKIHLGRKPEEGLDFPPEASEDSPPKEYFPTVYISDIQGLDAIPEKGTLTISYEIIERSQRNRDGKKTSSVELEIHEILDHSGEKKERKKSTREEVEEVFSELDEDE